MVDIEKLKELQITSEEFQPLVDSVSSTKEQIEYFQMLIEDDRIEKVVFVFLECFDF